MSKNNKLAQNYYKKSILARLKEIQLSKQELYVWRILGDKKVTAKVEIKIIKNTRDEVIFDVKPENENQVRDIITGVEFVNFYAPKGNILFRTEFKFYSADMKLVTSFPKAIAMQERRESLRLRVDEFNVKVNFQKDLKKRTISLKDFDKTCFDLSTGGISFIMTATEARYFEIGDKIFYANIYYENIKIDSDLTLVNLIPIEPNDHNQLAYKGFKACFSFIRISDEDKERIDTFVMSKIDMSKAS